MILFQAPYLTLVYDEQQGCLLQHWKGFAKSDQFRYGIQKSIDACKSLKPAKLISDTKELAVVSKEDTDWAASYATPLMVGYGLRHMAFIVPTNVFTQLSVKMFKSRTDAILEVQYFDELQKAQEWLAGVGQAEKAENFD